MAKTLFQGWTEHQVKTEFSKATAELSGLMLRKNDAALRKARAAAMIEHFRRSPKPSL